MLNICLKSTKFWTSSERLQRMNILGGQNTESVNKTCILEYGYKWTVLM